MKLLGLLLAALLFIGTAQAQMGTPGATGGVFGGALPGASGGLGSGGSSGPVIFTPVCDLVSCTYAYSTERMMVTGATKAIQVYRDVDATTLDVGFNSNHTINTAAVDTFCNASVAGVISRNCLLAVVYDQSAGGCDISNATVSLMPIYLVDPTHSGLPRFQKVYQGAGGIRSFLLDSNAGSTAGTTKCNFYANGPAESLFFAGNSSYGAKFSGQDGQTEGTIGASAGEMFSAYTGSPGVVFDVCVVGSPCGGVDTEGQGPQANYTRTANDDFIDIVTTHGGTGPFNTWVNNTQITTNETVPNALKTAARMTWGDAGDHTQPGPNIARSEVFFPVELTPTQVASLYSNETTFTSALTTTYQGPADIIGGENSYSTGLTNNEAVQLQWTEQCLSLRKCYASYEGPALNVCQGSGSCEDIGWVNNAIDVATMSAYCGPVSGLNNCAVQIWYNQALSWVKTTNTITTAVDATAVSSSNRPAILWSGCGTSVITVCVSTNATNYFTTGNTGGTFAGGYTLSAVAMRTGGTTSKSAILGSVDPSVTFIGFSTSANTCLGNMGTSATSSVACNDNTVHSITIDARSSPSKSTIAWADGTAGTADTTHTLNLGSGVGIGATGAGVSPCICQISEVLLAGDSASAAYNVGLGTTGVANLRANQRAAFGF